MCKKRHGPLMALMALITLMGWKDNLRIWGFGNLGTCLLAVRFGNLGILGIWGVGVFRTCLPAGWLANLEISGTVLLNRWQD